MTTPKKASSARDFLARRQIFIELPSGLVAEVRRPSILALVEQAPDGVVPPAFKNSLRDQMVGRKSLPKAVESISLDVMERFMNHLAASAFVSPRIVPEGQTPDYDANEIAINDLDPVDVQFVYLWVVQQVGRESAPIERFPAKHDAGMESASNQ